jgi:hypothetical protein
MKNKAALLSSVVLLLLAVLGCSRLSELSKKKKSDTNSGSKRSNSFTLDGKQWNSYTLENMDVTIELPGKPSDKTPVMPPEYRAVFSAMHISAYDEKDFQSSVTELVPTGARKFTIKQLADTSMTALKRQISDLAYTADIKSETNAKINGSFTKNGKSYDVRGCCIYQKTKPERVWEVLTLLPKDNADAQTASQRMISSVVFKNSTEQCN